MRALLTSILVVFTVVPFTFVSPLAAETAKESTLMKIQKRRRFVFGYLAAVKCLVAKSITTKSIAIDLFSKEVAKEGTADIMTFFNNKRINELNNVLSRCLVDNTEDCIATHEIANNNVELFQEIFGLVEQGKFLPVGTE